MTQEEVQTPHDVSDDSTSLDGTADGGGYAADGEEIDDSDDASCYTSRASPYFSTIARRKRKRPRPLSAVHPEIDPSLTKVINSREYQEVVSNCKVEEAPTRYDLAASSLCQLQRLLVEFSSQMHPGENLSEVTHDVPTKQKTSNAAPIVYGRHVKLEEALSFTPRPRILMQSSPPYRVVHANAAYADLSLQGTNSFRPINESCDTFPSFINGLFGSSRLVTVFPVWDDTVDNATPKITHYLVEANSGLLPSRNECCNVITTGGNAAQAVG